MNLRTYNLADIIRLKAHIKEHYAREYLKNKKFNIFSPDWICETEDGELFFVEVKHKEPFEKGINCDFDGQGMPYRQYKNYMSQYKKLGIRCKLIVYEVGSCLILEQWLDVLEEAPKNKKAYLEKGKIMLWSRDQFVEVGRWKD